MIILRSLSAPPCSQHDRYSASLAVVSTSRPATRGLVPRALSKGPGTNSIAPSWTRFLSSASTTSSTESRVCISFSPPLFANQSKHVNCSNISIASTTFCHRINCQRVHLSFVRIRLFLKRASFRQNLRIGNVVFAAEK